MKTKRELEIIACDSGQDAGARFAAQDAIEAGEYSDNPEREEAPQAPAADASDRLIAGMSASGNLDMLTGEPIADFPPEN